MGKELQDNSTVLSVKNPVDRAFLIYSRDISVPDTTKGVEVSLDAFPINSLKNERIQPLEFISITYNDAFGEKTDTFKSFREINSFVRKLAEHAPLENEGADRYVVYAEWQNKNGAAFKGFSAYHGFLYVTREMKHASNIVERAITLRDMWDAGLLKPVGISEEKAIDKYNLVKMFPKDTNYLLSALRHNDGLNGQLQDYSRSYEIVLNKQTQNAKSHVKGNHGLRNIRNRTSENELTVSGR